MNWEVPIMRSKTSLFNGSIFRSNFSRFWPLWAAYLVLLLIIVPTSFTSSLRDELYNGYLSPTNMEIGVEFLQVMHPVGLILTAVFSVFAAMAVYSFMYSPRTTGLVASLPVKREGVFLTSWLSGYLCLAAAQAITAFVTILIAAVLGRNVTVYVLLWLAMQLLETLCFYGLASLCAVLTGTLLILPAIYVIFNFLFPVAQLLVHVILEPFVRGMSGASDLSLMFLSPFITLIRGGKIGFSYTLENGVETFAANGMPTVIYYAIAGVVMSVGALLIYRRRRMETAADIVAINALKPVFRYCMAFGFAITLGIVIYRLVFGGFTTPYNDAAVKESILPLIVSMLVAGFIGYFVAEMMIRKSFKVFDKWPGYVAFAVVIIALLLAVDADLFGYERFVPETEKVENATVSIQGYSVSTEDPGQIDALRSLHSVVIEDDTVIPDQPTSNLLIQYNLRSGRTVTRAYGINGNALKSTEDFLNRGDILLARNTFEHPVTPETAFYSSVDGYGPYDSSVYFDLTPSQTAEFYNTCVLPDLNEGKLGRAVLYTVPQPTEAAPETMYFNVNIVAMEENDDGNGTVWKDGRNYFITPEAERSFAFLQRSVPAATTDVQGENPVG